MRDRSSITMVDKIVFDPDKTFTISGWLYQVTLLTRRYSTHALVEAASLNGTLEPGPDVSCVQCSYVSLAIFLFFFFFKYAPITTVPIRGKR